MPGAMEGYLLGYACRRQPTLPGSLQHLVLKPSKIVLHAVPEQSVGFITDGVVYNLLCLLHTGGHEHLAVGVRLYLLPVSCLMSLFRNPVRQAKESPFRTSSRMAFRQAVSVPPSSDALSWWEYSDAVQKAVGILLYLPVTVGACRTARKADQ